MKKRVLSLILILLIIFCIPGCSSFLPKDSTFNITFIDVGHGDSALIECDERYMLIDAGSKANGDKVLEKLKEKDIHHLDILVFSHPHEDHIGGMPEVLKYASNIDLVLGNVEYVNKKAFEDFEDVLIGNGAKITVPHTGDKFSLGSAEIEVVDVASEKDNDSLVLLITYGKTKFLFTGDIEENVQTRISDKYQNDEDKEYKIDLIKMPHHGSYTGTLYLFLRTFMPEYAVISTGKGNIYGHPHKKTLDLLNSKELKAKVYRTDIDGDIIVVSDGEKINLNK